MVSRSCTHVEGSVPLLVLEIDYFLLKSPYGHVEIVNHFFLVVGWQEIPHHLHYFRVFFRVNLLGLRLI